MAQDSAVVCRRRRLEQADEDAIPNGCDDETDVDLIEGAARLQRDQRGDSRSVVNMPQRACASVQNQHEFVGGCVRGRAMLVADLSQARGESDDIRYIWAREDRRAVARTRRKEAAGATEVDFSVTGSARSGVDITYGNDGSNYKGSNPPFNTRRNSAIQPRWKSWNTPSSTRVQS